MLQSASSAPTKSTLDRIDLMKTFIQIVRTGSLSAAAIPLQTTQATVSRRLQTLERLLEVRLIVRTTHTLRLTLAGELCFVRGSEIIESWEAFEASFKDASD